MASPAPAPAAPVDTVLNPVAEEPMTLNKAIKEVLKKALHYDGLARGLHESVRQIKSGEGAYFCVLAENAPANYKKLIVALCEKAGVEIIKVNEMLKLGEWVGLAKYDKNMKVRKSNKCGVCVVREFGEQSEALDFIDRHFKSQKEAAKKPEEKK